MNLIPAWLQWGMAIAGILGFLGAASAFLFVIWPSIRRQNRLGDRIEGALDDPRNKAFADELRQLPGLLKKKGTDDLVSRI